MRKIASAAKASREIIFGEEFSAREFIVFTVYSFNTVWVFSQELKEKTKPLHIPIYLPFINLNYESTDSSISFFFLSKRCWSGDFFFFLSFIPAQSQCLKRWNLVWNRGWQAFNVWRKLAENEWKSKSSKNLIFLMIFKSSRN